MMKNLGICLVLILSICQTAHAGWTVQNSGTTADLIDVCFVDNLHGWAIGNDPKYPHAPVIIATDDGGVTWQPQTCPFAPIELTKLWFVNENVGFIVSQSQTLDSGSSYILSTINGGENWEISYTAPYYYKFKDICFIDGNAGWVVGGIYDYFNRMGGIILSTKDGGTSWNAQEYVAPNEYGWVCTYDAIVFSDENHGWALGNYIYDVMTPPTVLYKTDDGGNHWSASLLTEPSTFSQHLHLVQPDTLWTSMGRVYRSYDGGLNWVVSREKYTHDFAPVSGTKGWALYNCENMIEDVVYRDYAILYTEDGGDSWIEQVNRDSLYFHAIDAGDEDFACAVGTSGRILTYDGGITEVDAGAFPENLIIEQNYPNPFNPFTTITYTMANPGRVRLSVYSITGQKIATLVDSPMTAGAHSAVFDGSDMASGIYLYRFELPEFAKTGKMLLIK